jgi:hypothetical protein
MPAASPWQPPPGSPADHLAATEPLYRQLMAVLHTLAREDANLSTMTTVQPKPPPLGGGRFLG